MVSVLTCPLATSSHLRPIPLHLRRCSSLWMIPFIYLAVFTSFASSAVEIVGCCITLDVKQCHSIRICSLRQGIYSCAHQQIILLHNGNTHFYLFRAFCHSYTLLPLNAFFLEYRIMQGVWGIS